LLSSRLIPFFNGCEARFPKHKRTVQVVPKMPMPVRTTVQVLIYTAKQYE